MPRKTKHRIKTNNTKYTTKKNKYTTQLIMDNPMNLTT
jgi:hypothetical protein